jgi:hypothetical protein
MFLYLFYLYVFFVSLSNLIVMYVPCGPVSSVGIGTDYGREGPGIEFRWGTRFSATVQTGPGAHPASRTIGTGSFPGVEKS